MFQVGDVFKCVYTGIIQMNQFARMVCVSTVRRKISVKLLEQMSDCFSDILWLKPKIDHQAYNAYK